MNYTFKSLGPQQVLLSQIVVSTGVVHRAEDAVMVKVRKHWIYSGQNSNARPGAARMAAKFLLRTTVGFVVALASWALDVFRQIHARYPSLCAAKYALRTDVHDTRYILSVGC